LQQDQQRRILEVVVQCREECHKASERVPVADPAYARLHAVAAEIDALTAELTGQRLLFGAVRPFRCH
jgi:hypothetical protein